MQWLNKIQNRMRIARGNYVDIAPDVRIKRCSIIVKGKGNRLKIGSGSILRNVELEIVGENCTLEIDSGSIIGHGCYLSVKERSVTLKVGKRANLSRNVKIMCADGHDIMLDDQRINPAKDIVIGDRVWLADGAVILKGCHIGDDSVVGIHAVVTRNIPAGSIAAGNPARVVRDGITNRWEHTW